MTHNNRLQPRRTFFALAGRQGWLLAAAAYRARGVGCFATCSKGMSGIDGVSEPGRARQWRDDT